MRRRRLFICLAHRSAKGRPPARVQRCPHFLRKGGFCRHRFAKAQRCAYSLRAGGFWRHRFAKAAPSPKIVTTDCPMDCFFVCLAHRLANRGPPARVQRCPHFLRVGGFCRHRFAKACAFARNGDDRLSTYCCESGEGRCPHERGVLSAKQPKQSLPPRAATQLQNQLSFDPHNPFRKRLERKLLNLKRFN